MKLAVLSVCVDLSDKSFSRSEKTTVSAVAALFAANEGSFSSLFLCLSLSLSRRGVDVTQNQSGGPRARCRSTSRKMAPAFSGIIAM